MSKPTASSPDDFDFIIGTWSVTHRRLNERLASCSEWTTFTGTSETRKVLQGFGNVEDNRLDFPDGSVRALALRSFDPVRGTWAIWWLDGRAPHHLDVPVVGRFADGIGTFHADDTWAGKPVRVRFIWKSNPGAWPTWEQAFSPDGCASWETNWTMQFKPLVA